MNPNLSESPHTQLHRAHVPRHQWLNGIEIIMRCNECYCRKEIPWNVDLRQVTGGNVKDEKRYKCIESQIKISHHITSYHIKRHTYSTSCLFLCHVLSKTYLQFEVTSSFQNLFHIPQTLKITTRNFWQIWVDRVLVQGAFFEK